MALSIAVATGAHIGDKKEQQDRLAVLSGSGAVLAVVADGMGGLAGGAMAAEQVISTARQLFGSWSAATEPGDALLHAIAQEAHVAIRLARFTSEQEPHSTVVALLIHGERAHWVHSGDSRLYIFRGATPVFRTVDHSYVEQLHREGKISAAERETHPQRNYLVSCLGAKDAPKVEAEYFQRTGIFPIMHSVALRQNVWEDNPWIARSLFKAFQRAKEDAYARLKDLSPYKISLAWFRGPVEEQERILGHDPWPYGLEKNRHVVETLATYLHEQGLADRKMPLEELFAPNTLDL